MKAKNMVAHFLIPALLLPVLMAVAPFDRPAHAAPALSFGDGGADFASAPGKGPRASVDRRPMPD